MSDYRLYCLDEYGKISQSEEFQAADDTVALEQAKALNKAVDCELWNRDRFVARLTARRTRASA